MLIPLVDANGQLMADANGQPLSAPFETLQPTAVWSLRQYVDSAPYALRIDVNGVQTDIGFGEEGHAQIAEATKGPTGTPFEEAAKVHTWYDQSGNGHHATSDAANWPVYQPTSRCLQFLGAHLSTPLTDAPFDGTFTLHIQATPAPPLEQSVAFPKLVGNGRVQIGGFSVGAPGLSPNLNGFYRIATWRDAQLGATGFADVPLADKITVTGDGATLTTYANGTPHTQTVGGAGPYAYEPTVAPAFFTIGGNGRQLEETKADFCEALVFPYRLPAPHIEWLSAH